MKTIYECALDYVGDPASHTRRGELILEFLKEEGLQPHHKVLNIGCGALSEGAPLIRYLNPGHYVGVDPNQWLIVAALHQDPALKERNPEFIESSDFTAPTSRIPYDFVVSHSVLSHVAFWQMQLALANVRQMVEPGAKWLASIILDQYTTFDGQWVYPGVSRFRIEDVSVMGYQAGWHVERVEQYRMRMVKECPNDTHSWLRLSAIKTPAEMNDDRLRLENDFKEARANGDTEQALRETFGKAQLEDMELARAEGR